MVRLNEVPTDSAISMQMINVELHRPESHEYHLHKDLLEAIARQILYRAEGAQLTCQSQIAHGDLRQ